MRDLFLDHCVDGHLIKELPTGFHVAVGSVRGEENAVDTDRVRQAPDRLGRPNSSSYPSRRVSGTRTLQLEFRHNNSREGIQ